MRLRLWTGIPAQGGRSTIPTIKAERALILAGLALLHGIGLALLAMQRITMQQAEMTLFVAPINLDASIHRSLRESAPGAGPQRAVHSQPVAPARSPSADSHPPQDLSTAPPAVPDWFATADAVVRDQTEAQAERERQAQALSSPYEPLPTPEAAAPAFHWDKSVTERMVTFPTGGMLIRLNDSCVLVLAPFPSAACALGKQPARGDLFEHMHDPPKWGDKLDGGSVP